MKKMFLFGIICFLSIFMVGCGCSNNNEPVDKIEEEELSGKFYEEQTIGGIAIKNFNIAVEDGESFISFDAENTLVENITVEYIKISLYDENDYLVLESYGYIGGTLTARETKNVVVETDIDLSNVVRVSLEKM